MPFMNTIPARAKGFTLIEVLVSMLVVSVGIFSILALITVSLQMNSSSVYRTIASQQAYTMAEIMRANPTILGTSDASVTATIAGSGVGSTSSDCWNSTGCARNSYIATMLNAWNRQLAAVLPSGTGTVCLDSTPFDGTAAGWACDNNAQAPYVVKVCWDESRIAASSSVTGGGTTGSGGALCTVTNL